MSRPAKDYGIWKNSQTGYFYYRISSGPWRTTGTKLKTEAEKIAREKWMRGEKVQAQKRPKGTVGSYFQTYFLWDSCPRIADRRADKLRISPQHAKRQRALLEKYIIHDNLMEKSLRRVIPDDIRAFRQRMIAQTTPRVVNAITVVLNTATQDSCRINWVATVR